MKMWKKSLFAVAAVAVMAGFVGCSDDDEIIDNNNSKPLTDTLWGMPAMHPEGWTLTYTDGANSKVTLTGVKPEGSDDEDAVVNLTRDARTADIEWPYAILHGMVKDGGSLGKMKQVIVGYKIAEGDTVILGFHKGYSTDLGDVGDEDKNYGFYGVKLGSTWSEGDQFAYDTIDIEDIKLWSDVDKESITPEILEEYTAISFRTASEDYANVNSLDFTLRQINFVGTDGLKADNGQ